MQTHTHHPWRHPRIAAIRLMVTLSALLCLALSAAGAYATTIDSWSSIASMSTTRSMHTATRLPNGKVLVAGGQAGGTCEVYDPATKTWATTGAMSTPRYAHTATLLPTGKVLAVGGYNSTTYYASAEVYDPATGNWSVTGAMPTAHSIHTATLLPSGKVLVVGGKNGSKAVSDAQVYDPATGLWTATGSLLTARTGHTASLLPTGDILVAGGSSLATAELYNTMTGKWTATGSMPSARQSHSAVVLFNGNVLVAGNASATTSAAIYNTTTKTWSAAPALTIARGLTTATILPNGKVLVANGNASGATAEIFDPFTSTWSSSAYAAASRLNNTATLLPNGLVLFAGGTNASYTLLSSAELYNYGPPATGTWTTALSKQPQRIYGTTTLLPNGNLLIAGGITAEEDLPTPQYFAVLYNPITDTWSNTGSIAGGRMLHSATLLPNGKVLIAGGCDTFSNNYMTTSLLYDYVTNTWSNTGSMTKVQLGHTATATRNGMVITVGGYTPGLYSYSSSTVQVYDYLKGTWSSAPDLISSRSNHTSSILPNGNLLITGGYFSVSGNFYSLNTTEIFDVYNNKWLTTAPMLTPRQYHTATELLDGTIMVTGGNNRFINAVPTTSSLSSVEIYNPSTGVWSYRKDMPEQKVGHSATTLLNGKVLITGGYNDQNFSTTSLIYDPTLNIWSSTDMGYNYTNHTSTLLPNGKVIITGGDTTAPVIADPTICQSYGVTTPSPYSWQLCQEYYRSTPIYIPGQ